MIKHLWGAAIASLILAGCGSESGAGTQASFEQNLKTCTPDQFSTGVQGLGSADYSIDGSASADVAGCSVTFVFTDNINPAWVGQPLRIVLKGERSMAVLMNTLGSCLDGQQPMVSDGTCTGPLLEVAGVSTVPGGPLAFGDGDFSQAKCGVAYTGDASARYRMHDETSDTWGYLDSAGQWVIKPQFTQAKDFSEGLAPVLKDGMWHVIDAAGDTAISSIAATQSMSYQKWDDRRVYTSPIDGFSEGCAVLRNDQGIYYLSRDGKLWLKDATPDMQAAADAVGGQVAQIFPFKSGLARFKIDVEAFKAMDPEGYIDGSGAVAIPAQYARAEDFDAQSGLAPAGVARDEPSTFPKGWVYINVKGEKVLPKGDSLGKDFRPFSEGFAIKKESFSASYIDVNGDALPSEKLARANPFSGGMAYIRIKGGDYGWMNTKGQLVFSEKDLTLCSTQWPERRQFIDGLVLLVISKDGQPCGEGQSVDFGGGAESYVNGEFAYVDTTGSVKWRASDFAQ